jgi:hypothetical protein
MKDLGFGVKVKSDSVGAVASVYPEQPVMLRKPDPSRFAFVRFSEEEEKDRRKSLAICRAALSVVRAEQASRRE